MGEHVTDRRLGEEWRVSYKWTGKLPSMAGLRQIHAWDGPARRLASDPAAPALLGAGLVACGIGGMLLLRRARSAP